MRRVKFRKGGQRRFFELVIDKTSSPSLRGLLQFGFGVNYSTLKGYYSEKRLIPEDLFKGLCGISGVGISSFRVDYLDENWGQVLGGKRGKRGRRKT